MCKIQKVLTFHIARHTFATTITLNNDVPIESVSKMLGHKKLQTTQHYAKILDKKVSNDMSLLRNKFKANLTIANKNLEYSILRAPFNGVVSKRLAEPGMVVSAELQPATLIILSK